MGANKRTPENAKIANAILQALFRQDGQTVQQVRDEINAESDEYQTVNGVLTSLQKREEITRVNGRYFLTPFGRKQVAPPGPVKPAVIAPLAAPAPARNVEVTLSKDNVVTYPLSVLTDLVAQDDAAVLRGAEESIAALRAIEAALPVPGDRVSGLSAAAIADRAVAALHSIHDLRRTERLYYDDRAAKERAEAERDKAVADLDRVNNETLTAYETLEDEHRAEKAAHFDAKAEIASLREQLNAANAALAFYRAEPPKPSDADGHYWTEQGGRHVLSVLRPVDLATVHSMPGSDRFGWELNSNEEHGFSATLERAQAHAELAAGVACVACAAGRLAGGAE